jgi:hypothetical protein
MKGYRILVIALLLTTAAVQSTFAQKEKYQSIFIYNFSKYVKWPEGSVSGKFVIGVFGSSGIKQELDEMATTKNVGGTPIEVLQFSTTAGIEECHILYLGLLRERADSANYRSRKRQACTRGHRQAGHVGQRCCD